MVYENPWGGRRPIQADRQWKQVVAFRLRTLLKRKDPVLQYKNRSLLVGFMVGFVVMIEVPVRVFVVIFRSNVSHGVSG
jgi:hypothetical protein